MGSKHWTTEHLIKSPALFSDDAPIMMPLFHKQLSNVSYRKVIGLMYFYFRRLTAMKYSLLPLAKNHVGILRSAYLFAHMYYSNQFMDCVLTFPCRFENLTIT